MKADSYIFQSDSDDSDDSDDSSAEEATPAVKKVVKKEATVSSTHFNLTKLHPRANTLLAVWLR